MNHAMARNRLADKFNTVHSQRRGALITFVTAGDPSPEVSKNLVSQLPKAGSDIIELGMPFSDPMADGPVIQSSSQRALAAGMTLSRTLSLVKDFRLRDDVTPIILMGYFNPIYQYGSKRFVADAITAGVDGLIVVDLPPEEDKELCYPSLKAGLNWIRLITPTTDETRIQTVLKNSSGFVYYVSITGITGTQSANPEALSQSIRRLKQHTDLPIAVGFGIKTPKQVVDAVKHAEAVVVGSTLVTEIEQGLKEAGERNLELVDRVLNKVRSLSTALRNT